MTREERLSRISITLVDPQDCQNIGSVCRAAKTMGIHRLKIVGRSDFDEARVRQLAVHAWDVFEGKLLFSDLEEALLSSSLSVAFTRRKGKFRKGSALCLFDLVQMLRGFGDGNVDLVFGRESDGLTDEEIGKCNAVCTIETSPDFPSLNLAQAVQIAAHSIFVGLDDYAVQAASESHLAATRPMALEMSDCACRLLDDIGYFKKDSHERESFSVFLRDFLMRGSFSESEMGRIGRFFGKLHDISKYKRQE